MSKPELKELLERAYHAGQESSKIDTFAIKTTILNLLEEMGFLESRSYDLSETISGLLRESKIANDKIAKMVDKIARLEINDSSKAVEIHL